MAEHFEGKVSVKGLLVRNGRILMVRAANETRWDLPGGRVHIGESTHDAFEREIKEELGVGVVPGELFHSCQTVHSQDKTNHLFLTFRVVAVARLDFPIPTDEVAEIRWVSKQDMAGLESYENCIAVLNSYWLWRG